MSSWSTHASELLVFFPERNLSSRAADIPRASTSSFRAVVFGITREEWRHPATGRAYPFMQFIGGC